MEDISILSDKAKVPTEQELKLSLSATYKLWTELAGYVMKKYPEGRKEWNYTGKKYGWSYRIKDKKRAILYFLTREKYFKVAFVFGQKATDAVLKTTIDLAIKTELEGARKYAEGREVGIDVRSAEILS